MKRKPFTVLPPSIRNWFVNILDPFVDIIVRLHVHPNHFTILGLIASIIGAIFYAKHDIRIAGLFILIGGILLLTPGLITDGIGFLMLIPDTRRLLREYVKRKLKAKLDSGQINIHF